MDTEMLQEFLQEARDLLETTDEKLVQLEKTPNDHELMNAVFRGYHTIKGGAGFMELHGLVRVCHALETLFDAVRSGTLPMNPRIMDASLMASNEIRRSMSIYGVNPDSAYEPEADLIYVLEQLAAGKDPGNHLLPNNGSTTASPAHTSQVSPASEPAQTNNTPANPSHITSPSDSAPQSADQVLEQAYSQLSGEANSIHLTQTQQPLTSESTLAFSDTIHSQANSPKEPAKRTEQAPPMEKVEKETQIKVDTNRLDAVLTLTSEVGLAKNRVIAAKARILSRDFSDMALSELERAVSDLDRLSSTLQNAVMLTRMQPIGRLFSKYPRIVRDLSRSLNKKIDIELTGHETEVDKAMIEDLADPLIHLIRNSADHGIENPQTRVAAGKSEMGMIWLSAKQEGDRIMIEIRDDGKGIDAAFIRSKAKEKGLMDPSVIDAMGEQQSLELIFAPGFSTAEKVSSVSGRGVGMDVVKTNIQKLGGEIHIQSTPGTGTLMTIRIPLTLAVLPALLLKAGDQPLALPLGMVQEIVFLTEHIPQVTGGNPVINLRGEILRVHSLAHLLGWAGPGIDTTPVAAIVDLGGGKKCALSAQGFIGREEVMVKALDGPKPKGVSGVIVDAQGEIVLILDLKELMSGKI